MQATPSDGVAQGWEGHGGGTGGARGHGRARGRKLQAQAQGAGGAQHELEVKALQRPCLAHDTENGVFLLNQ